MGYQKLLLGMVFLIYLVSLSFIGVNGIVGGGSSAEKGVVIIHGKCPIGRIHNDFVCATLDWWPPQKCDWGKCSWGHASLLNLDLNNKILLNAVKAFSPLKIRLGGTLQDKVTYGTADNKEPCTPFVLKPDIMFSFTQGCLPMQRWDELNSFFQKAGVKVIFGLNALAGRSVHGGVSVGPWNPTNAESFIRYTVSKKYNIHGWEFGNELCGVGIGTSVAAAQYASDIVVLRKIIQDVYRGVEPKPLIIAPGGFFDGAANWFKEFLNKSGESANAVTHHIYNLGAGIDDHLVERILDPTYLDGVASTFSGLKNVLQNSGTSAEAWVGEAGGAYSSGCHLVSDAFVNSFWYLDQLGMSATYGTRTYCRQTLIGGNYGLLNTTTFNPNPDYYSALLWHRLMGGRVLSTSFYGTKKIRTYAHCAKESKGVTILFLNLDNSTTVNAQVALKFAEKPYYHLRGSQRREYHLTAKDGNLHSQIMLLNGNILSVNSDGDIPPLNPIYVDSSKPITVGPLSIVFTHIPDAAVKACS
ncbi:heparanase-like protein 3 isoform X1 [Trifolium pratense]|uniref:heparanase-like protein 3 isoform X1 n=1 Tax=Trifolium pratense TaxID=57577 RepID=UPI001E693FC1|nr:heparanase-like protein 3 isoform X1 [Trifolium pratense]